MHIYVMSLIATVALITTVATFFYIQYGFLLFIPFIIVALMALLLWVSSTYKSRPPLDKIIIPYGLAIISLMLLSNLRILSGFASIGHLVFTGLFLCSGYCLVKRMVIGYYVLSFLYLWCIFQGGLQFYMAFIYRITYINYYYLTICIGVVTSLIGIFGIYQLSKPSKTLIKPLQLPPITLRQVNLWTAFILNLTIFYFVAMLFNNARLNPDFIVFCVSILCGIFAWRKINIYNYIDLSKILPLYCLTLGLFMFHLQEEIFFQFSDRTALLLHTNLPEPIISFITPLIMVYAIIGLWLRQPLSLLIVWVTCAYIIFSQPLHFLLYPVVEAIHTNHIYHYFPGIWTALWPIIPATGVITYLLHKPCKHNH